MGVLVKKFAVALALVAAAAFILSGQAQANALDNFVVTSTYNSSAGVSVLSAPNASIMLSFSLAPMLPSSLQASGVPTTVSYHGTSTMVTSLLDFFTAPNGGLFDMEFTYAGQSVVFEFVGPQVFDAADNLLLDDFGIAAQIPPYASSLTVAGVTVANIASGTVAISSNSVSPMPEPASASLLLLGTVLLGLGAVLRKRQARPANRPGFFQAWVARRRTKYS
jgi:hypothetical protein